MEKRPFWIIWTYIANYSERPIKVLARTPEEAVDVILKMFSPDFDAKADIYVFDRPPCHRRLGKYGHAGELDLSGL